VGVNVGAVDQTVTFANGQLDAAVTVPILSGAPNPGEVDVNLTISSVDGSRPIVTTAPLELRILASDATVPPHIVSTQGKANGIVLTFSKPMNPVEASNVNLGQGLTDLEGNPIGGELTPGKFSVAVFKGYYYPPY
jgi:hypothetical protein